MLAALSESGVIAIIGLVTTVILTIIGLLLKKMDDRNSAQHAEAQRWRSEQADTVNASLGRIEAKVDAHLMWHVANPPTTTTKEFVK